VKAPKKEVEKFLLRLQADLKQQLEQLAVANVRSLNGEIVARLQESVEQEKKHPA
jgi:hypothetical protein